MDAIIVRVIDLPHGINGMTVKDENDDYNIYINARLSSVLQNHALRHEIAHIRRKDFYCDKSVKEIEKNNGST